MLKAYAEKDTGKERKTATETTAVADKKTVMSIVKSPETQQPKDALREQSRTGRKYSPNRSSDEKFESKSETKHLGKR